MNKQTAIVICNWNKKEDVLRCVEAVFDSTYLGFDVIVVDNASTDGSVEALEQSGYPLKIMKESINIGGAGGFNSGMRYALQYYYKYIVLLDNDAFVERNAIAELVRLMEADESIGLLGAKLYIHGTENRLQEFGSYLDWDKFQIRVENKGVQDCGQLPQLLECDYVPACALIARAEVIREVGLMDEQFFIYWDDIEWAHRIRNRGYKVMVTNEASVWHKMGAAQKNTTFPTYYFWRNRMYFFLMNIKSKEEVILFSEEIFNEMHRALFFSKYNLKWSTIKSVIFAFEDAISITRGKALDGRILPLETMTDKLYEWAHCCPNGRVLIVQLTGHDDVVLKLQRKLESLGKYSIHIINRIIDVRDMYDYTIYVFNHILDAVDRVQLEHSQLHIDSYNNIVTTNAEYNILATYPESLESSRQWMFPVIKKKVSDFIEDVRGV